MSIDDAACGEDDEIRPGLSVATLRRDAIQAQARDECVQYVPATIMSLADIITSLRRQLADARCAPTETQHVPVARLAKDTSEYVGLIYSLSDASRLCGMHADKAKATGNVAAYAKLGDRVLAAQNALASAILSLRKQATSAREDAERVAAAGEALLHLLDSWAWTNHRTHRSPKINANVALDDMNKFIDALHAAIDVARAVPDDDADEAEYQER